MKRFAIRLNMAASPPGNRAGPAPAPSMMYETPPGGVAPERRLATNPGRVNRVGGYTPAFHEREAAHAATGSRHPAAGRARVHLVGRVHRHRRGAPRDPRGRGARDGDPLGRRPRDPAEVLDRHGGRPLHGLHRRGDDGPLRPRPGPAPLGGLDRARRAALRGRPLDRRGRDRGRGVPEQAGPGPSRQRRGVDRGGLRLPGRLDGRFRPAEGRDDLLRPAHRGGRALRRRSTSSPARRCSPRAWRSGCRRCRPGRSRRACRRTPGARSCRCSGGAPGASRARSGTPTGCSARATARRPGAATGSPRTWWPWGG